MKNATTARVITCMWKRLIQTHVILGRTSPLAAPAQILTATIAKLLMMMTTITSTLFAFVIPVSVIIAQSVQRWCCAIIVKTGIVWVALPLLNVPVLSVKRPFVILVNQSIDVSYVREAGVTIVLIAWIALIAGKDIARSVLRRRE